jgi:integrase
MQIFLHRFDEDRLEKVKDVFCFACFTGLRFSDVACLKRENIFENQLRFTVKKTQETTRIPLNEYALSILRKYSSDENPLPVVSSQKTNEYLKEIGKELKINAPVRIVKYIGNEVMQEVVPKHEVLTFHIARKTFITLSLVLGMNERLVRDFSGHKKDESFRRYVKFADNFRDRIMNETWSSKNIANAIL